jgi:hypothetical protein
MSRAKLLVVLALAAPLASPALGAAATDPYGFTVVVSPSAKARAKLQRLGETITISASFYGDPAPGAEKHADQVGQIDLGRTEVVAPATGGPVAISGGAVKRSRLKWLAATGVEVNVNVYSSRRSGPDNLLDCDFFQDAITAARRAPVRLACRLIGEAPPGPSHK